MWTICFLDEKIWLPTWSLEYGLWIEKPASCFITCDYTIQNVWVTIDNISPVSMKEELVFTLILCNISKNKVLHMIYCTAHQQWSSNFINCKSTVLSNDILEHEQQLPQNCYCSPFFSRVNRPWLLAAFGTPIQFVHCRPAHDPVLIDFRIMSQVCKTFCHAESLMFICTANWNILVR
jgi:hypothetical protein